MASYSSWCFLLSWCRVGQGLFLLSLSPAIQQIGVCFEFSVIFVRKWVIRNKADCSTLKLFTCCFTVLPLMVSGGKRSCLFISLAIAFHLLYLHPTLSIWSETSLHTTLQLVGMICCLPTNPEILILGASLSLQRRRCMLSKGSSKNNPTKSTAKLTHWCWILVSLVNKV